MKRFEKELVEYARLSHADLLNELKTTKDFDKELMQKAADAVKEFKLTFKPSETEK